MCKTASSYSCVKCNGRGYISAFSNVQGGVCFSCKGTGVVIQKTKPTVSKRFILNFLWMDEAHPNYNNGEYTPCLTIKAASMSAANKKAEALMKKNGSVSFKVVDAE